MRVLGDYPVAEPFPCLICPKITREIFPTDSNCPCGALYGFSWTSHLPGHKQFIGFNYKDYYIGLWHWSSPDKILISYKETELFFSSNMEISKDLIDMIINDRGEKLCLLC